MLKKLLWAGLFCGVSAAQAQVAPGQLGLTSATPNVVQVLDSTKNWSTIGTINTTTHAFTPTNAFPEAPNDATLYGRKSVAWSHITHNDITDWVASVPPPTPPGGTSGQIQYSVGGTSFGGFTANGDGTINTGTGAMLVTKTNGVAFTSLATTVPGTGVPAALGVNVGTVGSFVVNGGALGTPSSGTLTNTTGLPIATGVSGLGTGVATALAANINSTAGVATAAAPLTVGTGGTVSGAFGYYICTTTCTVTLPTPAAGFQFCVRNDSTVVTVITIAAISGVQFEKTTYNGYGTISTGTMVSSGLLGDKICLIGRDATHYLVGAFFGIWTNS